MTQMLRNLSRLAMLHHVGGKCDGGEREKKFNFNWVKKVKAKAFCGTEQAGFGVE